MTIQRPCLKCLLARMAVLHSVTSVSQSFQYCRKSPWTKEYNRRLPVMKRHLALWCLTWVRICLPLETQRQLHLSISKDRLKRTLRTTSYLTFQVHPPHLTFKAHSIGNWTVWVYLVATTSETATCHRSRRTAQIMITIRRQQQMNKLLPPSISSSLQITMIRLLRHQKK